jgi:aspartyl/asparaginyl beta-hydroxylase (cupin superfamily)
MSDAELRFLRAELDRLREEMDTLGKELRELRSTLSLQGISTRPDSSSLDEKWQDLNEWRRHVHRCLGRIEGILGIDNEDVPGHPRKGR